MSAPNKRGGLWEVLSFIQDIENLACKYSVQEEGTLQTCLCGNLVSYFAILLHRKHIIHLRHLKSIALPTNIEISSEYDYVLLAQLEDYH